MNYIYDILLNYNQIAYDIFEWNQQDNITHIKKIPLVRLNTDDLYNLVNNKVKVNNNFLTKIYQKTEVFSKNHVDRIEYSFLATDKQEVIAFKLDKMGNIKSKSKLIPEEEQEVIEYSYSISLTKIDYELLKVLKHDYFKTRNEYNIKKYINKEITKIINSNDIDKLKYLYLDCFNKKCDGKDIFKSIIIDLDKHWDDVYYKIYSFLKMTATKR